MSMDNTLCGNTWCQFNDKQCTCLIDKGVSYSTIEEVEKTKNKKLIKKAYGYSRKCYVKDQKNL